MTDAPTMHRWVATRDSARHAARAFIRALLWRPRWWACIAVLEVAFAVILGVSFAEPLSFLERAIWGALYAVVPTIFVALLILGLSYLGNRRRFRRVLREGVVIEGRVNERSVTLRSPWGEHVLMFEGLADVKSGGEWIFVKQKASPVWNLWPAELFPPADLARLRAAVAKPAS